MCCIIVINRGENEIRNPREFKKFFKVQPLLAYGHFTINPTACLCQIDIENTLRKHNINYILDNDEYHVTDTSRVEEIEEEE